MQTKQSHLSGLSRMTGKSRRTRDDTMSYASRAFSTTSSKRSKKSSARKKTKAKRAKRKDVDASEIFQRELDKLKRPKVLTVASLRQEMIDRRGTSANLLKKEYQNFRKSKRARHASENVEQLDFNALAPARSSFGSRTNDGEHEAEDNQQETKPRGDGLAATLSRWASNEGVSELDATWRNLHQRWKTPELPAAY